MPDRFAKGSLSFGVVDDMAGGERHNLEFGGDEFSWRQVVPRN